MNDPLVLSLCDLTGTMIKPWLAAGYRCMTVDIQNESGETRDGRWTRVGADVADWLPPRTDYAAVFAFPPCTDLASSGARWWREKGLSALIEGLRLVEACRRICEWSDAPWLLENPKGSLSSYWREPNAVFDPCDYGGYLPGGGDRYTKRTNLWVGGGMVVPAPKRVEPTDGDITTAMGQSLARANLRSATPEGFARAVFEANAPARSATYAAAMRL